MIESKAVEFSSVTKRRSGQLALSGISFDAPLGSTLSMLSSDPQERQLLLQLAAGLAKPSSGQVRVLGDNPYHQARSRKRIGFASSLLGFEERSSVVSNLRFAGRLHGMSGRSLDTAVRSSLERYDLAQCTHRAVRELTASESTALQLARATFYAPDVLLVDNLAHELAPERHDEIADLVWAWKEPGKTLVCSGHFDAAHAPRCDRILLLNRGQSIAFATPQQLQACLSVDLPAQNSLTSQVSSCAAHRPFSEVCAWILEHPEAIQARQRAWELENQECNLTV